MLLHLPASQGVQANAAPAPLNVPAGQFVQELALGALQVPAAHAMHVLIESPPGFWLYLPAAQARQVEREVAAVVLLNVPAGQSLQTVLDGALQEPTGQHAPAPMPL